MPHPEATTACLASAFIYILLDFSRVLAISTLPFVSGVHILPYPVRFLYTQKSSAWSNQFSIVLSILNETSLFQSSAT